MRPILVLLVIFGCLKAQNYEIRFSSNNPGKQIDKVEVENLTKDIKITISGDDILLLTSQLTSIESSNLSNDNDVRVYPNPSTDKFYAEFTTTSDELFNFTIYNVLGELLLCDNYHLSKATYVFEINNLKRGIYFFKISSTSLNYSARVVSFNDYSEGSASFDYKIKKSPTFNKKQKSQIIEMLYDPGDKLLARAFAGNNITIFSLQPSQPTETVKIDFVDCYDSRDGNNYSVVKIGKKFWMAENLKYLPAVSESKKGSKTAPYYYVYGYEGSNVDEAKNTENYQIYGVLYNWAAAMNGANSSSQNPSGVKGVCPTGWHLPSDAEWKELETTIGIKQNEINNEGWRGVNHGAMIAGDKNLWNSGVLINNIDFGITGFNGLPSGLRHPDGYFLDINNNASWWTATENSTETAWSRLIHYGAIRISRDAYTKDRGRPVRCVKD